MSAKTYLRFVHTIDIYQRTTTTNQAGQKTISFSKAATIPAQFQSINSKRRIEPYIANIDEYEFYVSYQDLQYISYNNRIQNVMDRYGNVIETGPLEITNIQKYTGFGGRLHHLLVGTRRVVEGA
jgi:head-tail adaptor